MSEQPSTDGLPANASPQRFHVKQRITPFVNRYEVLADVDGQPGPLIGLAQQKRLKLKEEITVYSDAERSRPVLSIKADRRIDIRSAMTVTDATDGSELGTLRKKGAKSLLRSTWQVEQPGMPPLEVTERNLVVALLRRFLGLVPFVGDVPIPWVFHFDGIAPDGTVVLTHTRKWGIRDRYVLEIRDPRLDARLAIALAICLDALQHR